MASAGIARALRESLIVTADFPQESHQGRRVGSA
jgi:hypothetical protein